MLTDFLVYNLVDAVEADIKKNKGHLLMGSVVLPVNGEDFLHIKTVREINTILAQWFPVERETVPAWTVEEIKYLPNLKQTHVTYRVHSSEVYTVDSIDDINGIVDDVIDKAGTDLVSGEPVVIDIVCEDSLIPELQTTLSGNEGIMVTVTSTTMPSIARITMSSNISNAELDMAIAKAKDALYGDWIDIIHIPVGKARDLDFAYDYVTNVFKDFDASDTVLGTKHINIEKNPADQAIVLAPMEV